MSDSYRGHLVFDCDGTLISSQEGVFQCIGEFMSTLLEREVSRQEVVEKYTPDIYAILERFDIPQDLRQQRDYLNKLWSDIAARHTHNNPAFPGIVEMLQEFQDLNFALYVWTARDRASTLEILKQEGIMPFIIEMRCLDDTMSKPHPQGLVELVGDREKSKVMVIGDSFTDIRGAKDFGCTSMGVTWSFHVEAEPLVKAGAQFIADTTEQCKDIILNHFE